MKIQRFELINRYVLAVLVTVFLSSALPLFAAQTNSQLSPNQLEDMVAPIALYPDPLLSQVLVASTYPLEVIQASQWLQRNPGLSGTALTKAAEQQNWDPSIQALVLFPDVLKQLSSDVTWLTNLGNAFLQQQDDVMNAVQRMRLKAQKLGKLSSTSQQQVTTTVASGQPVVVIVPVSPEVIYVPVYDPVWIWGPPIYYPYPPWRYPPRRGVDVIIFAAPIRISLFFGVGWGGWDSWGWHPVWGSRTVIVNNTFIHRYNFNAARFPNSAGTSVWNHDASHRHDVPYPSRSLNDKYRPGLRENPKPRPPVAARPVPGRSRDGVSNRPAAPPPTPAPNRTEKRPGSAAPPPPANPSAKSAPRRPAPQAPSGSSDKPQKKEPGPAKKPEAKPKSEGKPPAENKPPGRR